MKTATRRLRPVPIVPPHPLQAFIDVYLRNHVAQVKTAKEMAGVNVMSRQHEEESAHG